jgi:hypothetical protein
MSGIDKLWMPHSFHSLIVEWVGDKAVGVTTAPRKGDMKIAPGATRGRAPKGTGCS